MLHFIPSISIKPGYLCTYTAVEGTYDGKKRDSSAYAMPENNLQHGLVSNKANKRVRLAIDWLIAIAKDKPLQQKGVNKPYNFKLNFVTLTLSSKQKHSDNEIKNTMLNQFLTELREKYSCKNYIWRAESQKNGNIHFHVVTDVFIPWRSLRTQWNRIQNKLGYIDAFTDKTGKVDPNSTDVHSINRINNLSRYLAKYCSKNTHGWTVMATQATPSWPASQPLITYKPIKLGSSPKFYRQIHGKLWGLSQTLSRLQSAVMPIDWGIADELQYLGNNYPERCSSNKHCNIFSFNCSELFELGCTNIYFYLVNYANSILNPPQSLT